MGRSRSCGVRLDDEKTGAGHIGGTSTLSSAWSTRVGGILSVETPLFDCSVKAFGVNL